MQHIKLSRPCNGPARRPSRRIGADAAFAKALARSEFGKFYTDERELREVRRSLERAKGGRRGPHANSALQAEKPTEPKLKGGTRAKLWAQPCPRHRRSEIADAMARLKLAGRLRKEPEKS